MMQPIVQLQCFKTPTHFTIYPAEVNKSSPRGREIEPPPSVVVRNLAASKGCYITASRLQRKHASQLATPAPSPIVSDGRSEQ